VIAGTIVRRIGWALVVAWFCVTATFAASALVPADREAAIVGRHASQEVRAAARERYCLDRGVVGQYGCFVAGVVRGDLGESFQTRRDVASIVAARAWPTLQLALAAIALQLLIGVPLGVLAATRRGRWPDRATTIGALVAQSAPAFVVATLAMDVVAYRLGWLPIAGYGDGLFDRLRHLVLPAATLAAGGAAYYALVVRVELGDALASDYARTARAKGLSERAVVVRHALRNALGPVVTLVGIDLGALLAGAIVTEHVFAWPGLGRELVQAILAGDTPVVVGIVLVGALAIALANLLADLALVWLDPRLRA
jgi:peptide/nickel transport system permease protein